MGRVNLWWVCNVCHRENLAAMDPGPEEEEINWAPGVTLSGKCEQCGAKHNIRLRIEVELEEG